MIELKKISHSFTDNEPLFNEININIRQGQHYLLYGNNGVGKTTLLKIIAGLLVPQKGQVLITGQPPYYKQVKKKLSYIPSQSNGLFPRLTVRENISFFANTMSLASPAVQTKYLQWSDIAPFQLSLEKPFYKCSTGMKKLAIFFILTLHSPDILLIDELFENIDQQTEVELALLLNTIFLNSTIILSSHRNMTNSLSTFSTWNLSGGNLVS